MSDMGSGGSALGVIRDRRQTTFIPQSDLIGKPKSGFTAQRYEH
ncbi:hypothetical protein [Burkholderia sp. AU38729]|nr:hypothetical protein [Burkholderia sp. AU38729]